MTGQRKRHVAGLKTPRSPKTGGASAWWRRLGKGPKWLALTVVPLLLAAVVPGGAPWITDRTRDLVGQQPLDGRGDVQPELVVGSYWATDAILTDSATDVWRAIRNQGGVQMKTSGQKVTLESNRAARIDIDKITAVVEQRRAPLSGTASIADPQGDSSGLRIDFNLDAGTEIPAVLTDDTRDPAKAPIPYSANGIIRYIEQGKPEHLLIRASTTKCHCLWRVRIDYTYRGERGQIVVPPPDASPFATTAWASHKVQYVTDTGSEPRRNDCVAVPASCRPPK
jgi:hypothetical protein